MQRVLRIEDVETNSGIIDDGRQDASVDIGWIALAPTLLERCSCFRDALLG